MVGFHIKMVRDHTILVGCPTKMIGNPIILVRFVYQKMVGNLIILVGFPIKMAGNHTILVGLPSKMVGNRIILVQNPTILLQNPS